MKIEQITRAYESLGRAQKKLTSMVEALLLKNAAYSIAYGTMFCAFLALETKDIAFKS